MSDKQYDSVLVGYAEEPRYNDDGELMSGMSASRTQSFKEMIQKYATKRNEEGQGGNVYVTMFMSKNGKPCCRVFDPNSAAAKEKRAAKQQLRQPRMPSHSDRAPIYFMTARVAFKKRKVVHERVVWIVSVFDNPNDIRNCTTAKQ